MSNQNKAGALIISRLRMFSEAIQLFQGSVEPGILGAIDKTIEDFAAKEGWRGEFELAGDVGACWLAPSMWNLTTVDDDPGLKAWFDVATLNDEDDYWTALFCGQGNAGGEAGFRFQVAHEVFGRKKAWNAYAGIIDQALLSQLTKDGFKHLGKGIFFLPIHLDVDVLASTWEENGELAADDEVLDPVRQALQKLKAAQATFEQIMNQAPIHPQAAP